MNTNFSDAFLSFDPNVFKTPRSIENLIQLIEDAEGFSEDEVAFVIATILLGKFPGCSLKILKMVSKHAENKNLRSYANTIIEAFSAEVNKETPVPEEPKTDVE
jgi:hypothetical protein